jgi:hypothetical protein
MPMIDTPQAVEKCCAKLSRLQTICYHEIGKLIQLVLTPRVSNLLINVLKSLREVV